MRRLLILIFALFFLTILFFTIRASLSENILAIDPLVLSNRWFQATLVDAYLGFLTFYVWVFYWERSWVCRGLWLLAILLLGNLAMSAYVVLRLISLPADADWVALLMRPEHAAKRSSSA